MVTTPLCTGIFSDRATLSGYDNPVFNNLADEQGSVLAANVKPVNIITVSKNKKVITKELFSSPQILHHELNGCSRQWQQLPMPRPSNRRAKHDYVQTLHPAFNNK